MQHRHVQIFFVFFVFYKNLQQPTCLESIIVLSILLSTVYEMLLSALHTD